MADLQNKIKSWFAQLKTKGVSYKKHSINPTHEWRIVLVTTFILLCTGALLSFYFYTEVDQGKIFVVEKDNTGQEVKIDTNLLQKTVDDINARQDSLKKLSANGVPPEPSQ
jgi:hypothetical protein